MKLNDCVKSWVEHNLFGAKPSPAIDAYWYRGNVLFHHHQPAGRLEVNEAGQWILLRKEFDDAFYPMTMNGNAVYTELQTSTTTASIGVWNHFGQQVPSGSDLDMFMLEQFKLWHRHVLAKAHNVSIAPVSAGGAYWPIENVRKSARECDEARSIYCTHFGIDYLKGATTREVMDVLTSRENVYMNPKNVAARGRAKKKKLALLVLTGK